MTTTKAANPPPQEVAKRPIDSVRDLLETNRQGIQAACTKMLNADRLIRLVFVECRKNPQLLECTPASLLGAVYQMGQLGLEPGPLGLAYLVPYKNSKAGGRREVQFQPGYKGLVELARRSEKLGAIQAELVYKDDAFSYTKGLHPTLVHTPNDDPKASKEVKAVYAIGELVNGYAQFAVMSWAAIEEHKKKYVKASESLVWETEWGPKKTVLKKLCKLLPASTELHTAVALDDMAEAGISQHLGSLPELPIKDPIEEEETEELKDIQKGLEEKQQESQKKPADPKPSEPAASLAEEADVVEEKQPISDERWVRLIKFMDSDGMLQQHKHAVKTALKIAKLPPLIEPARSHFFQAVEAYCKEQGFVVPWPT